MALKNQGQTFILHYCAKKKLRDKKGPGKIISP